jgi:hypothetical protein
VWPLSGQDGSAIWKCYTIWRSKLVVVEIHFLFWAATVVLYIMYGFSVRGSIMCRQIGAIEQVVGFARVAITRRGQIWIIICKYNQSVELFSETEIVTFQHNLSGLRYTCASGPEACGCRSGRSLLVANVMEVLDRRSWGSFSTVFLTFLNALLHL